MNVNNNELVAHAEAALLAYARQGVIPDWSLCSSQVWSIALAQVVSQVTLIALQRCTNLVSLRFPTDQHAQFMVALCRQALLLQPVIPFHERNSRDFLPFEIPGNDTAILVFCGGSHRVGFPLSLAHQWFGSLDATVIYLFDDTNTFYFNGLASIGGGFEQTVDFLRQQLQAMGITSLYCYGSSLGTYAAIRFASVLKAVGVLAFAGPTNLTPDFLIANQIYPKRLPLVLTEMENALDLRQLMLQVAAPPQVTLFFGELNNTDSIQAANLAGLANVCLTPVAGVSEHNVVRDVILNENWLTALRRWRGFI